MVKIYISASFLSFSIFGQYFSSIYCRTIVISSASGRCLSTSFQAALRFCHTSFYSVNICLFLADNSFYLVNILSAHCATNDTQLFSQYKLLPLRAPALGLFGSGFTPFRYLFKTPNSLAVIFIVLFELYYPSGVAGKYSALLLDLRRQVPLRFRGGCSRCKGVISVPTAELRFSP